MFDHTPELEPPGEPPEPGGSSQPDPDVLIDVLIGQATDTAYLTVAAILALAIVVVLVLIA